MRRSAAWLVPAVVATLGLLSCTAGSGEPTLAGSRTETRGNATTTAPISNSAQRDRVTSQRELTFAVVTHGLAGDPFWDVVKNGAKAAGMAENVHIDYNSDANPGGQSLLIDTAVSSRVDGLIVSMADPDALQESITRAEAAGIPVVTINSGGERSSEFGALTHVGQSELLAGAGAGARLKAGGVTRLLCVIHEAGNVGLAQRCAGAAESFAADSVLTLQVNVNNVAEAQTTIGSALQADPSIDGVLTLNPAIAMAAVGALDSAGSLAALATFDLSGDVVQSILAGRILFAVDQQPYLQGYLPVVFLALYDRNGNTTGGGLPVLTGPAYVTKDNAADVAAQAANGTR